MPRSALVMPLACLFVAGGTRAQALPPLHEYHIRVFGPRDGLLAGDVTGIAQAPDGYLYVAGGRGLTRFDGYRFDPVALTGLESNYIQQLRKDSAGRIWLVTRADELAYLDGGRLRVLRPTPFQAGYFSETSDGVLWFGGAHGLTRVTPGAEQPLTHLTTADGLPADTVAGVFDLPGGERVVVTSRRLARIETDATQPAGLRFEPFGPHGRFMASVRLDSNGLWVPSYAGTGAYSVLRYHERAFTRYETGMSPTLHLDALDLTSRPFLTFGGDVMHGIGIERGLMGPAALSGQLLERAHLARDSALWLVYRAAREGRSELVRFRHGRFEIVPLRALLDFEYINQLIEDREGSLWIATDRGLFQLAPRKAFALTTSHGLGEGFTTAIVQTRDGSVWVATWGGGLHRFRDGRLVRRYTHADGLPDDRIRALYEASDGTLWAGGTGGITALRDGRIVHVERMPEEVRAFAEAPDPSRGGSSALWAGTSRGLVVLDGNRFVDRRSIGRIWALHATRDGGLWIGTERGLFRLAGDTLHTFGAADGLRSGFIASIHEEADGTLWIGTYEHGLHRYRGDRFVPITPAEGLHHAGIWLMLDDGSGNVWLSSDGGIARVQHARLHAVADAVERGEPPPPLQPVIFTETEGLPSRESNRASPGGWRLRDGRLAFNNLAGVVVIDPARAAGSRPPPLTYIRSAAADGEPIPHDSMPARLPVGTRQLAFDFAALSFLAPEQNQYRYRLDGYDDGWVYGGTEHRTTYTNLPPGRYAFQVQGATGESGWSEEGAFAFIVPPRLWQTWWLQLAGATALLALATAAYRYRVRRLLEMERLRLRIASDLHDDVGSSLSSIALLSEMLQGHTRLDEPEQRQLHRIQRAAEDTIDGLRDVIWLVDPKHDDLAGLIHKMRDVAGDLLNGTAHHFTVPDSMAPCAPGMAFMRNVYLIYKEALHNVARHASARNVTIDIRVERGRLVMRIRDDGRGFDERSVRAGRGLENMRRRARQIGGDLVIESDVGAGTRMTFSARIP